MISKNKKRIILYISPSNVYFGAERSLLDLVSHLNKNKYTPIVAVPYGAAYIDIYKNKKIKIFECGLTNVHSKLSFKKFLGMIRLTYILLMFIWRNNVDLIHINFSSGMKRLFPILLLSRKPYFFHIRMTYSYSFIERLILLTARKIICVSKAAQGKVLEKRRSDIVVKFKKNQVNVIYNGRSLSDFQDGCGLSRIKEDFNLKDDSRIVAIIGAICHRKRQDLFLLIAKELKKHITNVKYLIVGDIYQDVPHQREYKEKIIKMCSELSLDTDVVFTGFRSDVESILQIIDVVVVTSISEALGGQAIEAMAAAKPVVSSAVDGLIEIVKDRETGFLINSDDPKDYAKKVEELLLDDEKRRRMGECGRIRAKDLFDVKKQTKKIEQIYDEVI